MPLVQSIEHLACRYPLCPREWRWEYCAVDATCHTLHGGEHYLSDPVQQPRKYTNRRWRFSRRRSSHTGTYSTPFGPFPRTSFTSSPYSRSGRSSHKGDRQVEYVARGSREDQVGDGYVEPNCRSACNTPLMSMAELTGTLSFSHSQRWRTVYF